MLQILHMLLFKVQPKSSGYGMTWKKKDIKSSYYGCYSDTFRLIHSFEEGS